MRKVYVNVTTRIIMEIDENITVDEVLQEMDYNFEPSEDDQILQRAAFLDTEIIEWEIKDSK